jgi:hypothetical protein
VLTPGVEARILAWTTPKTPPTATSECDAGDRLKLSSQTFAARRAEAGGSQPHRVDRYMRSTSGLRDESRGRHFCLNLATAAARGDFLSG